MLGREHVGVAERFLHVSRDGRAVITGGSAAQPVVHAVAPDGVHQLVHAFAVEREELLHGGDALGVETDFSAGANAREISQLQMSDGARQLRREQADEPIGFLHIAGDLREVAIRGHADGAAQGDAHVLVDGLLDLERNFSSAWRLLLAAHELADHLVD